MRSRIGLWVGFAFAGLTLTACRLDEGPQVVPGVPGNEVVAPETVPPPVVTNDAPAGLGSAPGMGNAPTMNTEMPPVNSPAVQPDGTAGGRTVEPNGFGGGEERDPGPAPIVPLPEGATVTRRETDGPRRQRIEAEYNGPPEDVFEFYATKVENYDQSPSSVSGMFQGWRFAALIVKQESGKTRITVELRAPRSRR